MSITGPLKLNVQILREAEPAIGPGKSMVLAAIDRAGSISGAGRDLGMSYRRIWLLVDELNNSWIQPVVETRVGGGRANGARLTPFGQELLDVYHAMEADMVAAAHGEKLDWLVASLKPTA